jgi:hypothetical protein
MTSVKCKEPWRLVITPEEKRTEQVYNARDLLLSVETSPNRIITNQQKVTSLAKKKKKGTHNVLYK